MKIKFTVNTTHAEQDTNRVTAIVTALAGLTDPQTGKPPEVDMTDPAIIKVLGSAAFQAEAKKRLSAAGLAT